MEVPGGNRPDGWTTFGGGGGKTGGGFRSDEYGKSGQKQTHPTPSFSIPRTKPDKL